MAQVVLDSGVGSRCPAVWGRWRVLTIGPRATAQSQGGRGGPRALAQQLHHLGAERTISGERLLDRLRVGAAQPQPGFLDRVVCFGGRAEHPVGHRPQVAAVRLETLRRSARAERPEVDAAHAIERLFATPAMRASLPSSIRASEGVRVPRESYGVGLLAEPDPVLITGCSPRRAPCAPSRRAARS